MELYTSLTRLKQVLQGETLPAMTPVPEAVHHLIDPTFTIGQGALEEEESRGLRCPVRECGTYHDNLSKHLNRSHGDVGGTEAVKRALDIPRTVALVSARTHSKMSASSRAVIAEEGPAGRVARTTSGHPAPRRAVEPFGESMGYRNLRNRCEAQLREKLTALETKLGRSPSIGDTKREYGEGLVSMMKRVYGSWDNAKAQLGLSLCGTGRPMVERDAVLRGIRAFYDVHQEFPTRSDADASARTPLVCCAATTMRALSAPTWRDAMHTAAIELGLYRGEQGRAA